MFNSSMITGMIPLFVIIILLGAALFFVKKYLPGMVKKNGGAVEIKTVATHMVAAKKYVSLIKVQNKLLLIGISDQSITLLTEMEPQDSVPQVKTKTPAARVQDSETKHRYADENSDFAEILKKNLGIK